MQTSEEEKASPAPGEMDLMDHLRELRGRLMKSIAVVLAASVVGYCYSAPLFKLLSEPYFTSFPDQMMIGTRPAEAFIMRLKLSCFAGLLMSSPFVFLQIWLFISPGLYKEERKLVLPFVLSTTSLLAGGVWFCYRWVMPLSFAFFFQQYQELGITPTVTISEHMSFMIWGMLGFGVVFELPVFAYFMAKLGLIDSKMMISGVRYAIVIIFVVAAVLTPPDVLSQFLMAGPLVLLYGLSIVVVHFTQPIEKNQPEPENKPVKLPIGGA